MARIAKGSVFDPIPYSRRRPVIQGNLEQDHLHSNHDNRLRQQRNRIISPEPVEHPNATVNKLFPQAHTQNRLT